MMRNLDVILQTMGSHRSWLLKGVTRSEVLFRDWLGRMWGMGPSRERLEAGINLESTQDLKQKQLCAGLSGRNGGAHGRAAPEAEN